MFIVYIKQKSILSALKDAPTFINLRESLLALLTCRATLGLCRNPAYTAL